MTAAAVAFAKCRVWIFLSKHSRLAGLKGAGIYSFYAEGLEKCQRGDTLRMNVCVQVAHIGGVNVVEVSGIKELTGLYLDSSDIAISVTCVTEGADKKIKLSFTPSGSKTFAPFSFTVAVLAQRIIIAHLLDDSKVIIVPESIEEELKDAQEVQALLQRTGGVWMDGLPSENIKEIIACCCS